MKTINKLLIAITTCTIAFASCKKDDKDEVVDIENGPKFEFIVSPDYMKSEREWVLVYSIDHELLLMQELQNGATYSLKTTDEEYIIQTVSYDYYSVASSANYNFETYLNVKPGTWNFGEELKYTSKIGVINLNLNDINLQNYYKYELTSSCGDYLSESNGTYSVPQYLNPDNVWLMIQNKDEAPYYKWFPEVELNGSLSVSLNELDQMDDYIDITFPTHQSMSITIESEDDLSTDLEDSYLLYCNKTYEAQTSHRAYYLPNLFSGYTTLLSLYNKNIPEYMFKSRGNIPSEFEQLNTSISISSTDINSFNANINDSADVCIHRWVKKNDMGSVDKSLYYVVYGSCKNTIKYEALPIPEEIKNLDSNFLKLSMFEYLGTDIYEYDLLKGYDAYIKAFKEEHRDINKEGVKISWKNFHQDDTKCNINIDEKKIIRRIKQNPYNF